MKVYGPVHVSSLDNILGFSIENILDVPAVGLDPSLLPERLDPPTELRVPGHSFSKQDLEVP